jgi:hypothetical protein
MGQWVEPLRRSRPKLRNSGLALAELLALSATMVAHADPLAPAGRGAGAAPVIVRVWDGSGSGQHPRRATSTGRSVMRANGLADGFRGVGAEPRLGSLLRTGVPTYWVWGPGGGAFDYPFADRRGPPGNRFGSQEGRGRPF